MDKLTKILSDKLSISESEINDETAYNKSKNWDSITHLEITAEIEKAFNIELDIEEITKMEDVRAIKSILKNHGVREI